MTGGEARGKSEDWVRCGPVRCVVCFDTVPPEWGKRLTAAEGGGMPDWVVVSVCVGERDRYQPLLVGVREISTRCHGHMSMVLGVFMKLWCSLVLRSGSYAWSYKAAVLSGSFASSVGVQCRCNNSYLRLTFSAGCFSGQG